MNVFIPLLLLYFALPSWGQSTAFCRQSFSPRLRSLQVLVGGNPLEAPVVEMGKRETIGIEFDELSHDYHRYVYHIEHCNADWTPTEGLFESDYLAGFNDRPIEDYENSFNTTQLYTHYRLTLPNEDTRLRLSGNYRVCIFEDDDREDTLLQVQFCVVEPTMSIEASLSANTDIDFNQRHQQLSYSISYGPNNVVDPMRELHTVVMQNRRADTRVTDLQPNIQRATGVEFTHRRELIFPAGNEFHKFEILDVQKPGMNVDNMRWYEPYYHATLYADRTARNYVYDEDQDGGFLVRTDNDDGADDLTSEYLWVHFTLQAEPGLSVRLYGQWCGAVPEEECVLTYDEASKAYHAAAYLKQGYYNYQYVTENEEKAPDGNFFETENEYIILVYHRPQGGRYDKLVGYRRMKSSK